MWKWALFWIIVLGNSWIWKIFTIDVWLGLALVLASLLMLFQLRKGTGRNLLFLIILMLMLFWQQAMLTNRTALTEMPAEERFMRQQRVGDYPELVRRVGGWWELRPEMVVMRNVERNFWQAVDPNYYFFANHPREVVGVPILNKFPFVLIPLFLLGVFQLTKRKKYIFWIIGFGLPVLILSAVGYDNSLGPVVMFPGMVVVMSIGFEKVVELFINPLSPFAKATEGQVAPPC